MKKQSTIVTIEDGKVVELKRLVTLLTVKDGKYQLEISEVSKRSLPQNSYMHGILFPEFKNALISVGYNIKTNEQAKECCKKMFLTERIVNEKTGEVLEYTKHTAELTKEEMSIFIDEAIRFAAENMNYQIPFPGEVLEMNF